MKLEEMKRITEEFVQTGNGKDVGEIWKFLESKGYDRNSLYQELEMNSRLVDMHQDISLSGEVVQLHSHGFYELLYCCSDSEVQYLIGSDRYRLRRGDVVMIAPGVPHCPIWTEESEEPYRREVIWMSREFMNGLSAQFPEIYLKKEGNYLLLHTVGTRWEEIAGIFHAGVREAEAAEPGWQGMVCSYAVQVLALLGRALQADGDVRAKAEHPELLEQVMEYIEQNLGEKITLEGTAKQFLVSASTISQIFHKQLGTGFYKIVIRRRLISAKSKISRGMPMEEVAERVGFKDYSTFYRAFKQEYGISPRQYKNLGENS